MKDFKSITELGVLKYAWYELLGRLRIAEENLKNSPNDRMSLYQIKKYRRQADELNDRILELEKMGE